VGEYRGVIVGNIALDLTSAAGREPATRRMHIETDNGLVLVAIPQGDTDYGVLLSLDADSAKLLAHHLNHAALRIDPTPFVVSSE
jgi:hypothetical protein